MCQPGLECDLLHTTATQCAAKAAKALHENRAHENVFRSAIGARTRPMIASERLATAERAVRAGRHNRESSGESRNAERNDRSTPRGESLEVRQARVEVVGEEARGEVSERATREAQHALFRDPEGAP